MSKHVFWQALVVSLIIFWAGIMIGVLFENSRADKLTQVYFDSETNIFDIMLQQNMLESSQTSCSVSITESKLFADRIYYEAKELEKYDSSTKLTNEIINLHRRYDMLRVLLWKGLIDIQNHCNSTDTNVVVYIYQYNEPTVDVQARQVTFSKVLSDLKDSEGDNVILIPLAFDTGINSLNLITKDYNISSYPVVLINGKYNVNDLVSQEDISKYLN